MTNPDERGMSLVTVSSLCLTNFDLFEAEIRRMYGDKDRQLNAAIKTTGEYQQGHADTNESARSYANRIRTNWREAGWDKVTNASILYDIAWSGLRPGIRARIRPFASEVSGKFDSIDQLFDKAAGAESRTNPGLSKPRMTEGHSGQQKDKKRRFDGNHSGSGNNNSNSGTQFTSHFWARVCGHPSVDHRLSTAFHPQTDGQTERQNQTMEQYLRAFANYEQDNWVELLPLAKFAYNSIHSSTRMTPFFANFGYHPEMQFRLLREIREARVRSERTADSFVQRLRETHERLRDNLIVAQDRQTRHAGGKEMKFDVGDIR